MTEKPISNPFLTVLIPIYNEEKNIENAITLISEKLTSISCSFEILIIDDGSTDRSVEIVKDIMSVYPYINLYSHETNIGPGSGILTGIPKAKGDYIIFIPADIAMNIDQLSLYIDASRDADIVVGIRSDRRDYSIFRKIVSYINILTIKALFGMKQRQFNYISMYKSNIFKYFEIESNSVFITAEIMIKSRDLGFKLAEIDIDYTPREHGKGSGANLKSIIKTIKDMLRLRLKRTIRAHGKPIEETVRGDTSSSTGQNII